MILYRYDIPVWGLVRTDPCGDVFIRDTWVFPYPRLHTPPFNLGRDGPWEVYKICDCIALPVQNYLSIEDEAFWLILWNVLDTFWLPELQPPWTVIEEEAGFSFDPF